MDNNYNNNYNNDYNYNNYNQGNGYPPQDRKGMAIASLILGIISIPLGCCAYLGVIPGIIAVFLGIFSKGAAPRQQSNCRYYHRRCRCRFRYYNDHSFIKAYGRP